ncbi:hypothetical protein WUBG_09514, partial [Wuchereria bancrofti]
SHYYNESLIQVIDTSMLSFRADTSMLSAQVCHQLGQRRPVIVSLSSMEA